ncbi:hypothetical protein GCM10010124_24230 [Pilimelia terevasa]|uniref:alpha-amylase n=1 Tax=Pilimelia terevasa TaxID=53372 RepID=A0A8J3FHU0_9ACTN|nr:hypothetical protein GCM10010124_24230 [Pilimelia terevasa]
MALLLALAGAPGAAAQSAAGTIAVTLRDTDGSPLTYADVKVFDEKAQLAEYEGYTDEEGRAVFEDVRPGRYVVFFTVEGLKMWADSTDSRQRATVYPVAAGARVDVAPTLLPHARIAGTLTDADGGVSRGTMIAHPVGRFGERVEDVTDSEGRTALRVSPGTYRVEFAAGTVSQWTPGRPSAHGATEFALPAGERISISESLPETGQVHGTVVDAAGAPVRGATVRLHAGEYETNRDRSNVRGEFALPRVRAGTYRVSVTSPRGWQQWLPGVTDPAQAGTITVERDADVPVAATLLPTGGIGGTLYGANGAPTSRGWIFARPVPDSGSEVLLSATPDRQGRYELPDLAVGRYLVGFEINGRRQYLGGKGAAAASEPVTVVAGRTLVLDERAATGQPVTLRARDGDSGDPVADFCAVLVGPDSERLPDSDTDKYPHGCTDSGTLTVPDVLPGRYEAHLRTPTDSNYLPGTERLAVPADQPAEADYVLDRGGSVSVHTVARAPGDSIGRPRRPPRRTEASVADTVVYLVPVRPEQPAPEPLRTDANGAATFVGVPKGSYRIFAEPPGRGLGRQWLGPAGGVGREADAVVVTVRSGRTTFPPAVRLDPAGAISGTITAAASGRPVRTEVSWLPARVGNPPAAAFTDVRGNFLAGGFGPYAWPLRFDDGAHPSQWSGQQPDAQTAATVRVLSGAVTVVQTTLTRGVALTGTAGGQWHEGTITAVGPDGSDLAQVPVDPLTRRYRLPVLAGSTVRLRYEFQTGRGPRTGWYEDAEVFDAARPVLIPPGSGGAAVDFALPPLRGGDPDLRRAPRRGR